MLNQFALAHAQVSAHAHNVAYDTPTELYLPCRHAVTCYIDDRYQQFLMAVTGTRMHALAVLVPGVKISTSCTQESL